MVLHMIVYRYSFWRRCLFWVVVACLPWSAATRAELSCPDAQVLSGKLLTDICWSCLFPIRVAGLPMGEGPVPTGASNQSLCLCEDPLGLPQPGLVTGLWEPARLIELVRAPGCAPSLGGVRLPLGRFRQQGGHGDGTWDSGDLAFYHAHYYAFPLLVMLDLLMDGHCNRDSYLDFDLMYLSELDPTWDNEELAFLLQPEAAAVANPAAIAACMTDAVAATAGRPLDELFWCAGSWGHLYPLTGYTLAMGSIPENTSHVATRTLAAQHRRGLAQRTMGNAALCGPVVAPMLPKSQYRMSMFFPVPESQGNHVIGQSTFTWGEWRSIPATGEDTVFVLWRWQDCCHTGG